MEMTCTSFKVGAQRIIRMVLVAQALLLFIVGPSLAANAGNVLQDDHRLSLSMNGVSIKSAIEEIKKQTDLSFVYNERDIMGVGNVNLNLKNVSIDEALASMLKNTKLSYDVVDNVIVLKKGEIPEPQAKKRIIKGVVTDDTKQSLPGVSVRVKGLNIGIATDINGQYELIVDEKPSLVLEFSFVGMKTLEEKIGNRTEINVQMESNSTDLDEVMVVAYGTMKKEAFTGSAVSVKGDDVIKAAASKVSPERALQGNVAGVRMSRGGGQPGGSADIQIRGIGSLNESTTPLYVVDGVPTSNVLSMINPDDVESMTVLKDAAATSLYGSRASNGVIIINTKQGKEGKVKFDISYERGWSSQAMPKSLKGYYMNSRELTEYSVEALKNSRLNTNKALPWQENYDPANTAVQDEAYQWALQNLHDKALLIHPDDPLDGTFDYSKADLSKYLTNPRTYDWYGAMFNNFGAENKVNISARGGSDKLNYYTSLGYVNQKNLIKGSSFERYSGRISINSKPSKYFSFSLGESASFGIWNSLPESSNSSPISGLYKLNPTEPIYLDNGEFNQTPGWRTDVPNYIWNLDKQGYNSNDFSSISNLSMQLNFTDWLNFRTVNGLDIYYTDSKTTWTPESKDGAPTNGYISQAAGLWINLVTSNTFNFNKSFDKHSVSALVGYEARKLDDKSLSAIGKNFTTYKLMYMDNAAIPAAVEGNLITDRMVSYISKIDYNYDNKYYLSGSYRKDGSCRFLRKNRWGNFWSVSGAWNISKENFMASTSDWLDNLRLKLSYGTNGNQPGGKFQSRDLWSVGSKHNLNPALAVSTYGNPRLKWENSYTWNTGIDFSLWNGRLKAVVEYYNRLTKDLIDNTKTSIMSGWSSVTVNEGELRNTGVEFTIDSRNIVTDDFTWTTNFNISYMRAIVEKMKEDRINGTDIIKQGEAVYSIYTRTWMGVDPATGQGTWKKYTKDMEDQVIDRESTTFDVYEANPTIVGKPQPDWFGGLTNTFNYKGIEFSFLLTFTIGGKLWDPDPVYDGSSIGTTNWRRDHDDDYWKKPGDHARDPIVIYNNPYRSYNTSTRRLISSDHLRVKTVTLGYNLPKQWVKWIGLSNAKLYVNGNDVLTFFSSKYINPEGGLGGAARGADYFPSMKSWRVGINVQF